MEGGSIPQRFRNNTVRIRPPGLFLTQTVSNWAKGQMTFNLKKVLREMCMSSFGGDMVLGAGNEVGFLTCVTDKTLKHTQQRVCRMFIQLPGIPWDLDLSQRCLSF